MPAKWEPIAARKRAERDSKIPIDWRLDTVPETVNDVTHLPFSSGILSVKELDITGNYTAQEIIDGTLKKRWTSVEVTVAFCKRAAIAHQVTNCLSEIMFDQAIERARKLDKYLEEYGRPIGLLHGLPISLKDCFDIKGLDTCLGFTALAFHPKKHTGVLPRMLLDAGAILYVKTTVPQGQMAFDTHSYLNGRTTNPINRSLSAGGSSGGEVALIAMGGAVLGAAGDLGGSIRVPAANCGLYGIKPSAGRVSGKGAEGTSMPGYSETGLAPAFGPIARTLADCRFFLDVMARLEPWRHDAQVVPYSFRIPDIRRQLTIGLLRNDGVVMPHPPVASVLEDVAESLRDAGHRVHDIQIPEFAKALATTNGYLTLHGNLQVFELLKQVDEPLSPWLEKRMAPKGGKDLKALYKLNAAKHELEQTLLKKLWEGKEERSQLDVIVCPVAGHAAHPHDTWGSQSYTSIFNLLDYPAGVIPVRQVTKLDLRQDIPGKPLGPLDEINRQLWKEDTRGAFLGAPIAIQVVARKHAEGNLVDAMQHIDEIVKKHTAKL